MKGLVAQKLAFNEQWSLIGVVYHHGCNCADQASQYISIYTVEQGHPLPQLCHLTKWIYLSSSTYAKNSTYQLSPSLLAKLAGLPTKCYNVYLLALRSQPTNCNKVYLLTARKSTYQQSQTYLLSQSLHTNCHKVYLSIVSMSTYQLPGNYMEVYLSTTHCQ